MSYKLDIGNSLKEIINDVKRLQNQGDLEAILVFLQNAIKQPENIINALPEFDCEEVLLYVDQGLTVYYIATPPGILYPPHEHGMVAISALYKGTETHVFYDRDGEDIIERTRVTVRSPAIVDMEIDAIHAICTHDDVPNQGIHFYLGDLESKSRYLWDITGDNPRQYIHSDYLKAARPL